MGNPSFKDFAKKGFVQGPDGNLTHISKLAGRQTAKVKKLPNLLERAIPEVTETGGKIYIKPLSTNKAYKGKIFKTEYHKNYLVAVALLLPKNLVIPDGDLKLYLEFGFSSRASDLDNPEKAFIDALAAKYDFDDKRIYEKTTVKKLTKKGQEYICFRIEKFTIN